MGDLGLGHLQDLAGGDIDQVLVRGRRRALVARLAVGKGLAHDHAGSAETVEGAVDRGETDAMIAGGPAMDLSGAGMVGGALQYLEHDATMLGELEPAPFAEPLKRAHPHLLRKNWMGTTSSRLSPGWSDGSEGKGWARCKRSRPSWSRLATPEARSMRTASTRPLTK